MAKIIKIAAIFLTLSCATKSPENSSSEYKVVKIIKTKAFTTKPEFDKLVGNEPAYNMGYDQTIGMDFSWSIKHFDKYGNILKLINIMLDENGNEKIIKTTNYTYYSQVENKLSFEKTEGDFDIEVKNYIRDDKGKLIKIECYKGSEMTEKKVFSYNEAGQRIKEEKYKKEGITEETEYAYDIPILGKGKNIKTIVKNFKSNYTQEYIYKWSNEGTLISTIYKYYENGKLLGDITTNFISYVNGIATEEVSIGYDAPITVFVSDGTKKTIGGETFQSKIERSVNEKSDITKYSFSSWSTNQNGKITPTKSILSRNPTSVYECKYTFNQKNDWTEILFSDKNEKFLIVREIQYYD